MIIAALIPNTLQKPLLLDASLSDFFAGVEDIDLFYRNGGNEVVLEAHLRLKQSTRHVLRHTIVTDQISLLSGSRALFISPSHSKYLFFPVLSPIACRHERSNMDFDVSQWKTNVNR
jgi:hypothetical protein